MSAAPKSPENDRDASVLIVRFGADAAGNGDNPASPEPVKSPVVALPIGVLGGVADETIFQGVSELLTTTDGFRLFERGNLLIGAIDEPASPDLTAQAHAIYRRLLKLAEGRRLARIWNYVPCINKLDTTGLENYRAFCRGRSLAFEERLGEGYAEHLPAASAVGGVDGRLTVIFAAMSGEPEHFENPEQTPAYEYPIEHGPRSPSFARATRVTEGAESYVFISGTAAIKGHATIATGDLAGQIACTLDNLRIISRASGLGKNLGSNLNSSRAENDLVNDEATGSRSTSGAIGEWQRHFKIYLRHEADLAEARAALEGVLYTTADRVTWLLSDICREALLIEIEATLVRRVQ